MLRQYKILVFMSAPFLGREILGAFVQPDLCLGAAGGLMGLLATLETGALRARAADGLHLRRGRDHHQAALGRGAPAHATAIANKVLNHKAVVPLEVGGAQGRLEFLEGNHTFAFELETMRLEAADALAHLEVQILRKAVEAGLVAAIEHGGLLGGSHALAADGAGEGKVQRRSCRKQTQLRGDFLRVVKISLLELLFIPLEVNKHRQSVI